MDGLGRDPGHQVGSEGQEALLQPGPARIGTAGAVHHPAEAGGGVLEGLALEEAGEQQIPLLPQRQLLVGIGVIGVGKQPAGLQLEQHGRDQEELRRHLQVEQPELLEVGHEGVDDGRQRHLVDIDLLPGDQVEQQIEGALEDGCADLVGHP